MSLIRFAVAASTALVLTGVIRSQEQLFTVQDPNENLGASLANLGDVNGDGISDFVVTDGTIPGSVTAHSGAGGALLWRKQNRKTSTLSSFSLATLGDVNGDGVSDLLVGVTLTQTPSAVGICWILSGVDGATLLKRRDTNLDSSFGKALAGMDDLDGDLIPDWCAAKDTEVLALSSVTGNVIYSIPAPSSDALFGDSLASVGDLDGDRISDLLVGDPYDKAEIAGTVHVYSGATGTKIRTHFGQYGLGEFGTTVLGMDDVDRDGVDDYVITAPSTWSGHVYVYSGRTGKNLYTVRGKNGDHLGEELGLIGDITGDGISDFGATAGDRLAVHGRQLRDGSNGRILACLDPYRFKSLSYLAMDDLDGDGRDDFLCTGPDGRGTGIEAYRATDLYLFSEEKLKQVKLHVSAGVPFSAAAIFVVRVNGQDLDRFVSFGMLDANGEWTVPPMAPPPGLGNIVIRCQAFAVTPNGQLVQSPSIQATVKS